MKVLIANPPAYLINDKRHFLQAGSRWSWSYDLPKSQSHVDHYHPYPFWLGYSSALLKRDTEATVKAIDACALDFNAREFVDFAKSYSPDLLVTEIPTISFPLVISLLEEIKKTTDCKIVVAGFHITGLTKEVMEEYPFIDYGLIGEYELSLKNLVMKLMKNGINSEKMELLKGTAFHKDGRIIINERLNLLNDLDYIPFPDREDMPVDFYHDFEIAGKPCVQMWSSRGCPHACSFCLERQVLYASNLYRRRKPMKVVEEMRLCKEKYGAKQIYFDDMSIAVNQARHLRQICKEIIDQQLDIPWACMADMTLNHKTLKLMSKAGCVGLKFGVETVNEETIKKIGKHFVTTTRAEEFVKICRKLDIWTHATYIIGLPNDSEGDIISSLKFATELNTDSAQFAIATPFPGTPFFQEAKRKGWLTTLDWTMYDGVKHSVLNYPHFSKQRIEELCLYSQRVWKRHLIKQSILRPSRARVKRIKFIGLKTAFKESLDAILSR